MALSARLRDPFGVPSSRPIPPHAYFVGSAVFHYLGPSFAVLLFARVDVLGVAWLRIASAAVILAAWRRPWRTFATLDRDGLTLVAALGAVFALMNACFYLAIDRVPLATVAAIEFAGPITLAALGTRSRRNGLAVALAAVGVYLLTQIRFGGGHLGLVFAAANAVLFTGYIVLAHRIARHAALDGVDGLAVAMLFALVFVTPIGIAGAAHSVADPAALAAGVGVGVSSSVVPYVFDQRAMARLARATYVLFVSLLPAVAVVIGVLVLRQLPTRGELAGVALVMAAVALHRERATSPYAAASDDLAADRSTRTECPRRQRKVPCSRSMSSRPAKAAPE